MPKSIFSPQYEVFLRLLRRARERSGVTQVQLAKKLRTTQSAVSKCERGERRLDIIEVVKWCRAIGKPFIAFARELESEM